MKVVFFVLKQIVRSTTIKKKYNIAMEKLFITNGKDSGNLTVSLTFSDNTVRLVDVGDFIRRHPHPQYNKYLDPRKFSKFSIENGNIVWGKNWDMIFPIEQLYAGSLA